MTRNSSTSQQHQVRTRLTPQGAQYFALGLDYARRAMDQTEPDDLQKSAGLCARLGGVLVGALRQEPVGPHEDAFTDEDYYLMARDAAHHGLIVLGRIETVSAVRQ